MADKLTLMLGGIQGEGIVSTGDILIKALSRSGYYTYGCRTFSSRIKGGHTNYVMDICTEKIFSSSDQLDILIAMDQDTIEINLFRLKDGGLLLYDDIVQVTALLQNEKSEKIQIIGFPFTSLAKQHGTTIMKNTAIVALIARLLHLPYHSLEEVIRKQFQKKGEEIISKNLAVASECYKFPLDDSFYHHYALKTQTNTENLTSLIGNEAIALAALMAGCRFVAAYPITPASEIMEYLIKKFPKYNGVMIQTEDEISAVTMCIGASYAGCRSMTATSGPGISLMMEGVGLSGMAEIPLVIVDSQRGGPSTGLPTKHEQSDIQILYYGPHGEIPSIIVTPYSVEECFYQTIEAFNLADKYQCPVFILSDLLLGLSRQTIDELDKDRLLIDRGKLISSHELSEKQEVPFKRFAFTTDDISERSIPGQPFGMHSVTGIEHTEAGKPSEGPENRTAMMNKRLRKIKRLSDTDGIHLFDTSDSNILILSIGSNYGIIKRAVEESQLPVSYGMFTRIKPLPVKQLEELLAKYDKVLVVENNGTSQLAAIIKQELGYHHKICSLLKYDGQPFRIEEVLAKVKEMMV
ncbi:MAG: 2-oxoacid:acceptor oxidoreductase subunit alpha [Bacillota bacterium]